jgi:sugar-specific transcriptional regulator TrmB
LSQEKVIKTLEALGITQPDADIYIFLGKKGAQKALEISRSLKLSKQTTYRAIKTLQSKGIVTATLERPSRFSSVPFDQVLDLFVKAKTEEVQMIKQNRERLLSDWQSIAIPEGNQSPKFTVIEGNTFIYSKMKQIIESTQEQLSVISSVPGLIRAERFGIIASAFDQIVKTKIKLRLLTDLYPENIKAMKLLLKELPKKHNFQGRTPEIGLGSISRMIIRDNEEVIFFINQKLDIDHNDDDDLCLWTNSAAIVNSFKAVFESLWQNSTDIQKKIAEIENGRPSSKTTLFRNAEVAREKYFETIGSAEKEITILTSPQGIIDIAKKKSLLAKWNRKQISVKIMTPITNGNLRTVQQLSKAFQLKHIPVGYLETTLIDNHELFQFKEPPFRTNGHDLSGLENAFYSNDLEYIDRVKKLLDSLWLGAQPPFVIASHSSNSPNNYEEIPENSLTSKKLGIRAVDVKRLTEKEILDRIIYEKKVQVKEYPEDSDTVYTTGGSAIIHLPSEFKLPDLMIETSHIEETSSHGIGEVLIIYQWFNLEKGSGYAPVAVLMTNAEAFPAMKLLHANDPAAGNVHLVRGDELQIRTHGNTMFTGWTVPIPLFPRKYVLPPACLTIEGYGKVNSIGFTLVSTIGSMSITSEIETNFFNAFVTFNHPYSKYSGPGTDGLFGREYIMRIHPPKQIE